MTLDPNGTRPGPAPSRTNPFRQKHKPAPLPPQDARRQGAISALAFQLLGGRDPAMDFLNSENAPLGGRPIAIATRSEAGYAEVEKALRLRSSAPGDPR